MIKKILLPVLLSLLPISHCWATTGTTATPSSIFHNASDNMAIMVSWTVTGGASTIPHDSTVGQFLNPANGAQVGSSSINTTLSVLCSNFGQGTFCTTASETITIPADVLLAASSNGLRTILYQRSFSNGTTPSAGTMSINLTYNPPTLTVMPPFVNFLAANVTWNIRTNGDGSGSIASASGVFTDSSFGNRQRVLGSNTTVLNSPVLQATGNTIVSETIFIPPSVLTAAKALNLRSINYSRFFDRDPCMPQASCYYGTSSATVNIDLTSNPNAVLSLGRIALRFSDNTSIKIIQPDTSIMAVADISFGGTGLLDAMWEIAEPVSTMGQPVFVPMRPVRQLLSAGGTINLQSPPLPTQKQGLHIVRLSILSLNNQPFQQQSSLTLPILQYAVNADGDISGTQLLPPIRVHSPADNALLTGETQFNWQAVKGAHAYQLELFLPEQSGLKPDDAAIAKRAPDSGVVVPARKNSLTLSELSRNKLRTNTTYYWRVIAIGDKGVLLSTSALREIRIP
jgi:hypothetical protein